MTRHALRLLASALVALSLGLSADASAADVLVISNSGYDSVALDFAANTSHTYTGWNASATPTLADLMPYDVVLLFENGTFSNSAPVGTAVRSFVDAGGDVVIGTFYWQDRTDSSIGSATGWGTLEAVDPFTAIAGACEYSPDDLDPASIVPHPMTAGVVSLFADSYRGGVTAKVDTVVLATWQGLNDNGVPDPVIGYRTEGDACIAGVSVFPDYEGVGGVFGVDFDGDFYLIWDNVIDVVDGDCSACGDGVVDPGEACDDGGESAMCNGDCTVAMCGDGVTNMSAGEECDDAGETAMCDADCTLVMCGDGVANAAVGEECDDGGESATCDADCSLAMCGDLEVNNTAGETCDEGGSRTETCNEDCTVASCGDGVLNVTAGEECDDGGESASCDPDCTAAICGDAVVNAMAGEECDDGNGADGDGCTADCLLEGDGSSGSGGGTGGGGTGVDESGGGGDTLSTTGPGGDETGIDVTFGETPETGVSGCGCASAPDETPRGALWSLLGLLGLGVMRRRAS